MPTNKLTSLDKQFLKRLGQIVRSRILEDMGYRSLDAFSLQFHDLISKPTLYQLCDGERDLKLSTLNGLARALGTSASSLIRQAEERKGSH